MLCVPDVQCLEDGYWANQIDAAEIRGPDASLVVVDDAQQLMKNGRIAVIFEEVWSRYCCNEAADIFNVKVPLGYITFDHILLLLQ